MADLGASIKGIWLKGMEAIGNTASNIASSTKSKVDEMNLVNRRAEILKDFGNKAYALWQQGAKFPEELEKQLHELERLDETLNDLRAERLAGVKTNNTADETAEIDSVIAEKELNDNQNTDNSGSSENEAVPVIQSFDHSDLSEEKNGLSDTISNLFDKVPSAKETAAKVNNVIDSLGNELNEFSDDLDRKIDDFAEKIKGSDGSNKDN